MTPPDDFATVREALRWAWHLDECRSHDDGPDTCDCGGDDAVKASRAALARLESEVAALREELRAARHQIEQVTQIDWDAPDGSPLKEDFMEAVRLSNRYAQERNHYRENWRKLDGENRALQKERDNYLYSIKNCIRDIDELTLDKDGNERDGSVKVYNVRYLINTLYRTPEDDAMIERAIHDDEWENK